MFLIYLFNFLRGYVIIKAEGNFLERFINICTHRDINIWNLKIKGEHCLTAQTSIEGFYSLRSVCKKTGTRVQILKRKGLPFLLRNLRRRKALVFGFVLFVSMILWFCSHIWVVEIPNVEGIDEELIRRDLEKCGVKVGAAASKIDPEQVQQEMLSLNPQLSWFWPQISGTKVLCGLKLRSPKPDIVQKDEVCNIVAAKSGIIENMIVREGAALVGKGYSVAKDQLLVSGVLGSKVLGVRYVHADADIIAQTTNIIKGQYSLVMDEKIPTGKEKTKYTIKFLGTEIPIPVLGKQYAAWEEETSEYPLRIGKSFYMPISLEKERMKEVILQPRVLEREQVVEEARDALLAEIQKQIGDGEIIDSTVTVTDLDETTIEVAVEAKCREKIAKQLKIQR